MIDLLKKQIEQKIRKEITNRGDCEMISNAILQTLDVNISYNTIRRLFGLATYTKPNKKTLDILSKFLGYKNYFHFSQNAQYKEKTEFQNDMYKVIYHNDIEAITALIKNRKVNQQNYSGFIAQLSRELLYDKSYSNLNTVFKLQNLDYKTFTYSELLHIGNSIGLIIRKQEHYNEALFYNINFLHCVYLTFVDYSSLNGYYGAWAKKILQKKPSREITIFTSAILEFNKFINNKSINPKVDNLIYTDDLNPILCSRLLALKLLKANETETIEVLHKYYTIHSKRANLTDYSYELFTTSIVTKNLQIMEFLVHKIILRVKFYYQKSHLNSFYLMGAFYYKLIGDEKKEAEYNTLFSLNECRYSYEEFISLLYQIYLYGSAEGLSNKTKIKKKYIQLSKKLNYPYFSENYLTDYFK